MNTLDFIQRILIGDSTDIEKFPEELHDISAKTEKIAESNIEVFLNRVLELQKKEHIMVATNSTAVRNLVSALNMNFKQNKISVMYDYSIDTSELEAELENLLLHTKSGETYFPEESTIKNIFYSDDRILVKGTSANEGTELFNKSGQLWGTLLDKEYCFSHICGTVQSQLDEISIKEKAELMLMIIERNSGNVCSLSDIVTLSDKNKKRRFIFLSETVSNNNPAETEAELFTGLSIEADTGRIIKRMVEYELPAVLIEDINNIIMNKKYGTMQIPTTAIIRNTMERICIMN